MAAKAAPWLALRERGVSLNGLARRLGQPSTLQVRRPLDPKRPSRYRSGIPRPLVFSVRLLAALDPKCHSRLELFDRALAALDKRLVIDLVDAPAPASAG